MTTTRRSWIKSLVAMVCGAATVPAAQASPFVLRSVTAADIARFREEWRHYYATSQYAEQQSVLTPNECAAVVACDTLPPLGSPYPERPAWVCPIAEALGGTPLLLDGKAITDDMAFHAEWRCEAVPTGVKQFGNSWCMQYTHSDVMIGSLLLKDYRAVFVLAHRTNGIWRVEQCVCTNRGNEIIP